MRNVLHLHPHKHTGKLLHHRHTSYHALLLLLAVAGGFIALTNHLAAAASYDVSAIVPAPLPTTAANITDPTDGATVYTADITVAGTCPVVNPAIIVVLYDNGDIVGSIRCSSSGTFTMPVSLAIGSHEFIATIINFTGQTGLSSPPVTITYILSSMPPTTIAPIPIAPGNGSNDVSGPGPITAPSNVGTLQLIPAAPFLVFGPRTDTVWDGTILGGMAPYAIRVNWGDGNYQTYTGMPGGPQHLRHSYKNLGSYLVDIQVQDSDGHSLTRHYVALSPAAAYTAVGTGSTSSLSGGIHLPMMSVLYTAYFITVLCFFGLWIYEKRYRRQLAPVRISSRSHAQHYHKRTYAAKRRRHR